MEKVIIRKCFSCGEVYPYTSQYWAWKDKEHTKFRSECRKCTNYASKMSHRIARARKKEQQQ